MRQVYISDFKCLKACLSKLIIISLNVLHQLALLPEQMNPSDIFGCEPLVCTAFVLVWFSTAKAFLTQQCQTTIQYIGTRVLVKVNPSNLFHQEFLTVELDLTQTVSEMCKRVTPCKSNCLHIFSTFPNTLTETLGFNQLTEANWQLDIIYFKSIYRVNSMDFQMLVRLPPQQPLAYVFQLIFKKLLLYQMSRELLSRPFPSHKYRQSVENSSFVIHMYCASC